MKNIKVIMCDIDGTLLNSKGIVTSKTIDAIKKVREQGILFGISTGRDVPSVKRLFGNWANQRFVQNMSKIPPHRFRLLIYFLSYTRNL